MSILTILNFSKIFKLKQKKYSIITSAFHFEDNFHLKPEINRNSFLWNGFCHLLKKTNEY
jgi:hypothetical protein